MRRAGTEILYEDIGLSGKIEADLFSFRRLQIENDAFLVPVQMSEVKTKIRVRRKITIRIACGRRFDFDHARAEIRQQRRGIRPGDERGAFDYRDIRENLDGHEFFPA